jgi:Flp pilus assembly protein TadD
LAQAHAGVGFSRYWFDYDWVGAEQAFRSALTGNSNAVSAHHGLALLLLTQGRRDEGFAHMRLACELEPMSPVFNTLEASFLLDSGQLGEARVRLDRAFDLAPNLWLAHVALGLLLIAEGQTDAALGALRRAAELGQDTSRPKAVLAVQLARAGQRDEARSILDGLLERAKDGFVTPTSIAAIHAALDEPKLALESLEQARRVRDTRLIFLKDDPNWSSLRREPRFAALMKDLKLGGLGPGLTPV